MDNIAYGLRNYLTQERSSYSYTTKGLQKLPEMKLRDEILAVLNRLLVIIKKQDFLDQQKTRNSYISKTRLGIVKPVTEEEIVYNEIKKLVREETQLFGRLLTLINTTSFILRSKRVLRNKSLKKYNGSKLPKSSPEQLELDFFLRLRDILKSQKKRRYHCMNFQVKVFQRLIENVNLSNKRYLESHSSLSLV